MLVVRYLLIPVDQTYSHFIGPINLFVSNFVVGLYSIIDCKSSEIHELTCSVLKLIGRQNY